MFLAISYVYLSYSDCSLLFSSIHGNPVCAFTRSISVLFCDLLSLTMAVCVIIGLEVTIEAWWANPWFQNWRQWCFQNLSVFQHRIIVALGVPILSVVTHCWQVHHSCCEFMIANAISCPKWDIAQHSSML